jgi:uncharacterized protein (DUF2164 family)
VILRFPRTKKPGCGFEAEFLIDFFAREIGPHFYNRGLFDAQQVLTEKMDEVGYVMQELEKPEG